MNAVSLKKILGRRGSLAPVLQQLIEAVDPTIGVLDGDGTLLAGRLPRAEDVRHAVTAGGEMLGWVTGSTQPGGPAAIASLLAHAAAQEAEKRSVAAEALERYRELNLLYTLSEKLAAAPEPAAIAGVALEEAGRLIGARAGLALAVSPAERRAETAEGDLCAEPVAAFGHPYRLNPGPCTGGEVIHRVLASGQPELIDDVPASEFFEGEQDRLSVVCAPLRTEKAVLGALLLVRRRPESFAAGELKLLNTVALQVAPAVEIARLYQVAVEKARMERELHLAREVQASLLPANLPQIAGWQFAADWRPALEVAGDYYDVLCEDDGHISLAIADVSGKGMAASLLMVFARSVLRAADPAHPPAERIERANRLLARELPGGMFITLFYARLDPRSGQLTYVNAGHNPPLLFRSRADKIVELPPTGMALGILDDAWYEQHTVHLVPGEMLLLYTDGVTEAFDARGEQFGMENLTRMVRRGGTASPRDLIRDLEQAVATHTGAVHPSDDVTVLAVKRL